MKDSAVLDQMYEQNLHILKNFPCIFLQAKRNCKEVREGKLTRADGRRQRQADFRKMHRQSMIWQGNVTGLRRSFMIWS